MDDGFNAWRDKALGTLILGVRNITWWYAHLSSLSLYVGLSNGRELQEPHYAVRDT